MNEEGHSDFSSLLQASLLPRPYDRRIFYGKVTLNLDGPCSPISKVEQPHLAKSPQPEVITISDDDE